MNIDIAKQRGCILAYFAHRGITPARGLDALEFAIEEWGELFSALKRREPQWTRNNPRTITDNDIIYEIGDAYMMMVLALDDATTDITVFDEHKYKQYSEKGLCLVAMRKLSYTHNEVEYYGKQEIDDYEIANAIHILNSLAMRLNMPNQAECAQRKFAHKTGRRFE